MIIDKLRKIRTIFYESKEEEMNRRISNLEKTLGDHPHDEQIKTYGQCKICKERLDSKLKSMKILGIIFSSIVFTICLVLFIIGDNTQREGLIFSSILVVVFSMGFYFYQKYFGVRCSF
jgi:hypothetical protein